MKTENGILISNNPSFLMRHIALFHSDSCFFIV